MYSKVTCLLLDKCSTTDHLNIKQGNKMTGQKPVNLYDTSSNRYQGRMQTDADDASAPLQGNMNPRIYYKCKHTKSHINYKERYFQTQNHTL